MQKNGKLDIFVHPDFPNRIPEGHHLSIEDDNRYIALILETIASSNNKILVADPECGEEIKSMFNDDIYDSLTLDGRAIGVVSERDRERLEERVGGNDDYVVHGAEYGFCPTAFAIQLYGITEKNRFWQPHIWYKSGAITFLIATIREEFKKSPIGFGIMHAYSPMEYELQRRMTRQFDRENTVIFNELVI